MSKDKNINIFQNKNWFIMLVIKMNIYFCVYYLA